MRSVPPTGQTQLEQILAPAAAAATGILVGAAIVATRSVVDQTGPASLALLRYLVGFVCLLGPALAAGGMRFERRDVVPIALLGITQFGILVVLLNFSLKYISSARAALIFATMPLLAMLIGAVRGEEQLSPARTLGVLLTIVGVGLALGERALGPGGGPAAWIGELAAFASALSGALCSVLYRPYLTRYPTLAVSAFAMLASDGFLAILAAREGFFVAPPHFGPSGWLAVLFIGLSSGVGYYLWLWALGHSTPTKVTVFLSLSPVTATALGALLLAEAVSPALLLGLLCVALGLWLANR